VADYIRLYSIERVPLVIFEINVLQGPHELLADSIILLVADPRHNQFADDRLFGGLNVHLISKPLLPQIVSLRLTLNEPGEMNDLSP
jgi:hypothetical protein